ncbi:MAG: sterol desaturase/sphingolipid hydroxylase (fatty acid hydroxylase superfamily) [Bermanella sp.]|jgi:sterol desaturase/sphingolipid hydroxylase (fatty acid hydroxylase superfamily)
MTMEILARLCGFGGILLLMLLWEYFRPLRADHRRWARRRINLGLVVLDTVALRVGLPVMATGVAIFAEERSIGVLHWLALPLWLKFSIALLVLDLAIYWQHRLFHRFKPLWRLHAMHHSDLHMDTTTGLRFHPLEILLSMLIKMLVVLGLGAPLLAVVAFEVLLNATALFNHSNITLPDRLERLLRRVIVTPDMHRVHHSVRADEHHRNFSFNLSVWDRLFGSYRAQPADGHSAMAIGLKQFRREQDQRVPALLLQPFRGDESPD